MKTNQVYTCHNADCARFLYDSKILLDVIISGSKYSLNCTLQHFEYFQGSANLPLQKNADGSFVFTNPTPGTCPHCLQPAAIIDAELNLEADRQKISTQLDQLESLVADLMIKFKDK